MECIKSQQRLLDLGAGTHFLPSPYLALANLINEDSVPAESLEPLYTVVVATQL